MLFHVSAMGFSSIVKSIHLHVYTTDLSILHLNMWVVPRATRNNATMNNLIYVS